jgi:hypothetical protein
MARISDLFQSPPAPAASEAPSAPGMPPGVAQIVQSVNAFMPAIEQITGLTRRDIFLSLLKGGMKGQGFESILNTLMGHQEKEVKFVKYVKVLAIWVPIAILLLGLSIVSIVLFTKFLIVVLGVF